MAKKTINDVALAAGVSKATISRYLNQQFGRMSPATREKIARVIADLDYVPNHNAAALKTNRSHQVGVVVADVSNPYSTFLLKGIARALGDYQDQILIADSSENPKQEEAALRRMLSQNVDGVILQPAQTSASEYAFLKAAGVPVVLVDRLVSPSLFPTVTSNDTEATKALGQVLVEKGYKQVLFLSNELARATVRQERYEALEAVCKKAGIKLSLLEVKKEDLTGIKDWYEQIAGERAAIFAANGRLLTDALRWTQQAEIAVPQALGLCGYDDSNWGDLANPPLSVVAQNPVTVGQTVGDLLEAQLAAGELGEAKRHLVPAEVIVRSSL